MIYLNFDGKKMVILEPGNIERLKQGRIAATADKEVVLAYAPDHVWLQQEIFKIGAQNLKPEDIARLLDEGLKRPEVINRPYHPTWDAATAREGKA